MKSTAQFNRLLGRQSKKTSQARKPSTRSIRRASILKNLYGNLATKEIKRNETWSNHWRKSCQIALSRFEWRSRHIWECLLSPCTWMMQRQRLSANFTKCKNKRRSRLASRQSLSHQPSATRCGLPFRLCSSCCRSLSSFSKPQPSKLETCPTS